MRAAVLAAALLLGGCITQPPLRPEPLELSGVPFFPQTEYQCGPAALATVLADSGIAIQPSDITDAVFIPEREGSLQVELLAAARRNGRLPYVLPPERDALFAELEAGRPVLVLQNLLFKRFPKWHYAVVTGYLPGRDRFVLNSGETEGKLERTALFLRSWDLADRWGVVVVGPGELPASATPDGWARTLASSEGRVSGALTLAGYDSGLERWPDDPLLLFASANYLLGSDRHVEAQERYLRLLSLQPDHAAARNNLANLLLEEGCVARARDEIERALADIAADDPLRAAIEDTGRETDAADPGASRCALP